MLELDSPIIKLVQLELVIFIIKSLYFTDAIVLPDYQPPRSPTDHETPASWQLNPDLLNNELQPPATGTRPSWSKWTIYSIVKLFLFWISLQDVKFSFIDILNRYDCNYRFLIERLVKNDNS